KMSYVCPSAPEGNRRASFMRITGMKRWQKLIRFGLVSEARTLWRVLWHKSVPMGAKATIALALAYVFMPIDAIPDLLPILGWADDLTILTGLIYLAYRMVPADVMEDIRGRKK